MSFTIQKYYIISRERSKNTDPILLGIFARFPQEFKEGDHHASHGPRD